MVTIEPTADSKELAALNEAVQDLHCKLFPAKFKPFNIEKAEEAFNRLLSNSDFHALVAKVGNVSIGYLLCFIKSTAENEFQYAVNVLHIDQISVNEKYRNAGVGQQLLERAIGLAQKNQISEIQLDYWEGNTEASSFFTENGFKAFNHRMMKKV